MEDFPPRCLLIARQGPQDREDLIQDHLLELAELARSCGFAVQARRILKRSEIASKTFYGSGQLEALAGEMSRHGVTHLICDDELRGSQVNAIEKSTGLICLDRTGLILSIFEQRAQTREAKAQVELARCEYELPRLSRAPGPIWNARGAAWACAAAPAKPRSKWIAAWCAPASASSSGN